VFSARLEPSFLMGVFMLFSGFLEECLPAVIGVLACCLGLFVVVRHGNKKRATVAA
jgi:hypothetical protein